MRISPRPPVVIFAGYPDHPVNRPQEWRSKPGGGCDEEFIRKDFALDVARKNLAIAEKAREVRDAQKRYFKSSSQDVRNQALIESKRLELELDALLSDQGSLFPEGAE